jgi:hypothetical protein
MARVASKRTLPRRKIIRLKATPAEELGTVEVPDAEPAIRIAVERLEINDPDRQRRLVARRMG